MNDGKGPLTYQKAGVDPDKAAHILGSFSKYLGGRPRDKNLVSGIGPFASCYSLKEGLSKLEDPILVTCCDGVGTKAKLALDWNKIDTLGEDLVAMNVNDLLCTGAKPILFLDYYACGKLDESQLMPLLKSIQHACELAGCSLAGGETAEMPGVYSDEDFDLAGFSVGLADRKHVLGAHKVSVGDTLVAIESSGLHSNGYSLVRKLVDRENISPLSRTPFSVETWAEALLKPTHIYVKALSRSLSTLHAAAHITGGGLFENLPRVLPNHTRARVMANQWKFPPLFQWLQEKASLTHRQLLSTFNCGVGMIAVIAPGEAAGLQKQVQIHGLKSWEIGVVESALESNPEVIWQE